MKPVYLMMGILLFNSPVFCQKNPVTQTSNLNLSKSNINRLIYPSSLVTAANAQLLVDDLEKQEPMDAERQKSWLVANFKRFGIDPLQVKQVSIFTGRQFADCTICKKNCKGRCVQDPGADCVCISHSEPNLRIAESDKTVNIILLSLENLEEEAALELSARTIGAAKRSTVKSSKSNSSE